MLFVALGKAEPLISTAIGSAVRALTDGRTDGQRDATKYIISLASRSIKTHPTYTIWGGPKSHAFVYITDSIRIVDDRGGNYIELNPTSEIPLIQPFLVTTCNVNKGMGFWSTHVCTGLHLCIAPHRALVETIGARASNNIVAQVSILRWSQGDLTDIFLKSKLRLLNL